MAGRYLFRLSVQRGVREISGDRWGGPPKLIAPYSLEINSSLVLNSQLARYRQVLIQTSNLCQQ